MHMVEETEHKTVAYDTYMACGGGYLPRAVGILHSAVQMLGYGLLALFTALRKDGNGFGVRRLAGKNWGQMKFFFQGSVRSRACGAVSTRANPPRASRLRPATVPQ